MLLEAKTPQPYESQHRGCVFGQDSVGNTIYNNQLFWFSGDTRRGDRSLENFKVSAAVSPLPENTCYDLTATIDLTYFMRRAAFIRQIFPLKGDGSAWLAASWLSTTAIAKLCGAATHL